MGGANAASTRDATAQWHDPAAFGFFGRSEWATHAVDNGNLSEQGFSSTGYEFTVLTPDQQTDLGTRLGLTNDTEDARAQAKKARAVAYFRKPEDDQALIDAIGWALSCTEEQD